MTEASPPPFHPVRWDIAVLWWSTFGSPSGAANDDAPHPEG